MVNLITGPRGSGKTQQMIDLANEKVKTSNGNVVFIKKSHKDTYTVDFNIRVIRMADYPDVLTLEEFVGFLYGMAAGNHDIEAVFIDSVLKQANITLESLAAFLHKLNKISTENNIDFISASARIKKIFPESIHLIVQLSANCCIYILSTVTCTAKRFTALLTVNRFLILLLYCFHFGKRQNRIALFAFFIFYRHLISHVIADNVNKINNRHIKYIVRSFHHNIVM